MISMVGRQTRIGTCFQPARICCRKFRHRHLHIWQVPMQRGLQRRSSRGWTSLVVCLAESATMSCRPIRLFGHDTGEVTVVTQLDFVHVMF